MHRLMRAGTRLQIKGIVSSQTQSPNPQQQRRPLMRSMILVLLVIFCFMPTTLTKATLAKNVDSKWGAIAYSYATGKYGLSYDYPTQAKAINSAVERCKAPDCKAVV